MFSSLNLVKILLKRITELKSMVTKREEIEHEGLKISIEPIEEKAFYLTGETLAFKVVIENLSSKKQKGKLFFRWILGNVQTIRPVTFELNPLSKSEHEFPKEWLYREGTAIYELLVMPIHKERKLPLERYSIHPFCSYYVRDKDLYNYEKAYRRAMMSCSLIIIVLTIINLLLLYGEKILLFFQNCF